MRTVGGGHEADLVLAGLVGREGEAAGGGALLGDDAVVVVKDFLVSKKEISCKFCGSEYVHPRVVRVGRKKVCIYICLWLKGKGKAERGGTYIDGNVHGETAMLLPRVVSLVILFCCVVSHDEGILGDFLEEAFWRGAVDVEIQSLGGRGQ